jgi:hypothetical protein
MSKKVIGLILNLIGSVAIGLFAGQKFYSIFDKTVPAGSMTELVRAGTHSAYLLSGALFGVAIFAWTALAAWMSRFFPAAPAPAPSTLAK